MSSSKSAVADNIKKRSRSESSNIETAAGGGGGANSKQKKQRVAVAGGQGKGRNQQLEVREDDDGHDDEDVEDGQDSISLSRSTKPGRSAATIVNGNGNKSNKGKGRAQTQEQQADEDSEEADLGTLEHSSSTSAPSLKRLELETASLRIHNEQLKQAYRKTQKELDGLLTLRQTDAEKQLEEQQACSDERIAAYVKSVDTYASEAKALREEISALKHELHHTATRRKHFTDGGEGEEDMPDGDTTTLVPETQTQEMTVQAGSTATAGAGRNGAHLQTRLDASEASNAQLQAEVEALEERIKQMEREQRSQKKASEAQRAEAVKQVTEELAKQAVDAQRQREQLEKDYASLQKELAYEVQQSKALQQQSQQQSQQSHVQNPASLTASTSTAAGTNDTAALQRALEAEQALVALLGDLVSITALSHSSGASVAQPSVFTFIMSDAKKKRHLHFKLGTHPADKKIDFMPDLEEGRDAEVLKYLDENLQGSIKFDWDHAPNFFKRLWKSLNETKR